MDVKTTLLHGDLERGDVYGATTQLYGSRK